MRFQWSILPPQPLLAGQLARELGLPPLAVQCLLNRQLNEPASIGPFIEPRLKQLADPFLLPNMGVAVDRLLRARAENERVVVFGDYDVDGVTSTALLLEVLGALGWKAGYYLPRRMDEGYGLSAEAAANCLNQFETRLLLAVDCGSSSREVIASLRQRGVEVIVLDHHQISSPAPEALAIVNPRVGSGAVSEARFLELCSVGLAFKCAHALLKRGRDEGLAGAAEYDLKPLLDLVALGTVADLVPLTGENRILVSAGLARLSANPRAGVAALKQVAQSPPVIGVYETGFQLAPRLNAAGRLETAEESLQLLLTRDPAEALRLARNLDARNRERQAIERRVADEALQAAESKFQPENDFAIVEGNSEWHIGVVGIVASRVLHRFYRPVIIAGGDGDLWRGSGRSIEGFDLGAALRECDDLLVRHGGHAMAAGVTLHPAKLPAFRERFNQVARRELNSRAPQPSLRIDAEAGLEEMTLSFLKHLDLLKPFGQGNPQVHFCARRLRHQRPLQRIGNAKQHVKMWVTDGALAHEAVWWGAGGESLPAGVFDLAFAPQVNTYNGRAIVQLKVLDWRPAD
jgi:single-stranded-DNA-specific exonuclease